MKKSILAVLAVVLILFVFAFYGTFGRERNNSSGREEEETKLISGSNGSDSSSNEESSTNNTDIIDEPLDDTYDGNDNTNGDNDSTDADNKNEQEFVLTPEEIEKIKPNEAGKIMVVMFHNFIEKYEKGDKEYTTTFSEFEKLLENLYERGYRLINLSDYLNNRIDVPAGCIPIVFTFDDGTSGQFNLVDDNGKLVANRKSAVGIMEEFAKKHPDFGLKGTFYVNLGLKTFNGQGTLKERLQYLIDKGFEIGNHTMSHVKLPEVKSAEKIQEEVGGNQKIIGELIPGYKMNSLALPFGLPSTDLKSYVAEGEYEGIKYKNEAILKVGANPAPSPVSKDFDPLALPRVRASGIEPVNGDLAWWLDKLTREQQYISDGNPDTITIPKEKEVEIDTGKLDGKKLVVY
ncbi:MAG TPA: polysaccharide deacetylase family protein [Clostridiaceae bacterium]|nr:polysaccharide deacetylase family protein [Clostridiaceae bacterium]